MRVLTWNLFFGRTVPESGRNRLDDFAAALAGWDWDVAMLQEVPWWWPPILAEAADAQERHARTAPRTFLGIRRFLAERWPDKMRSGAGGCNAILARCTIVTGQAIDLRRRPRGRVMHAVLLQSGIWIANLHASAGYSELAQEELDIARRTMFKWARGYPFVLGGDANIKAPQAPEMEHVAGNHVDHLFATGLLATGPPEVLDRGQLSDHAPLVVELERTVSRDGESAAARS
jgi:endonuclease/exonuclease/phosphatase family metal-dependent hydrolase